MKTSTQEEKIENCHLLLPYESRVGSSHDEATANEPGKPQLLFPSSSLLEIESTASSSVVDSAAATAFKGILDNVFFLSLCMIDNACQSSSSNCS